MWLLESKLACCTGVEVPATVEPLLQPHLSLNTLSRFTHVLHCRREYLILLGLTLIEPCVYRWEYVAHSLSIALLHLSPYLGCGE